MEGTQQQPVKLKQLLIEVEPEIAYKFKEYCVRKRTSMREEITEFLKERIAEGEK